MILNVDNGHTNIGFAVKHMMITTVRGNFGDFEAKINLDEQNFANSTVEATVQVASIETRDEKRDGHLRSSDFFAADQFPTLTFKSKRIENVRGDSFDLVGDLTIRGVTKEVTLKANREGSGVSPFGMTVFGFTAESKINRKDFGLNWNVALEAGGMLVGEEVKIVLDVEALAAPAYSESAAESATADATEQVAVAA